MTEIYSITIFSKDVDRAVKFYRDLFGFPEMDSSPIFRGLLCGSIILGFHTDEAYDLLGLRDMANSSGLKQYVTFDAISKNELDERVDLAITLGARLIKAQYVTYYNHYQAVLIDPDDNVFRISYPLPK